MLQPKRGRTFLFRVGRAVVAAGLCLAAWGAVSFGPPLQTEAAAQGGGGAGAPAELRPGQSVERELKGGEAHRYGVSLRKDEFLQVRAEQKGVDVTLRLLDAGGATLATMDSPNAGQGPETLSFVAERPGDFVLEVGALDAKAEKGAYSLRREEARRASAADRRRVEVERLFAEGMAASGDGNRAEAAARQLSEAKAGWAELADSYMEGLTGQRLASLKLLVFNKSLQTAGDLLAEGQRQAAKSKADAVAAKAKLSDALALYRDLDAQLSDKALADEMSRPGVATPQALNFFKALQYFAKLGVALSLNAVALTHYNLGEWREHVDDAKLSVVAHEGALKFLTSANISGIDQQKASLALRGAVAGILMNLGGTLHTRLNRSAEALTYLGPALEQTRALYGETRDPDFRWREALILQEMGLAHLSEPKDRKTGIEHLLKAVEIQREFPNQQAQVASALSLIATYYGLDFDYGEALRYSDAALEIYNRLGDKSGQAEVLQFKGTMYNVLDDRPKVRETLGQALLLMNSPEYAESFRKRLPASTPGFEIYDEFGGALLEQTRLERIAYAHQLLEEYDKSLEHYEKALAVARAQKDGLGVRAELRSIAFVYTKLERWDKAYEYARQALEITRAGSNKDDTASDLADAGWALLEAGRPREALAYQSEALTLYQSAGVGARNAFTPRFSPLLNELARTYAALGNRRMAIFFGKQGVNAIQGERRRLRRSFDADTQKRFLIKKEKNYRRLADWLIAEGRIPEAEQVLDLLKQEEVFEYLRRDAAEADDLRKSADLSPEEREALARYNSIADELAALGAEYSALDELGVRRTPAQQQRYEELPKKLDGANEGFQVFLKQLAAEFGKQRGLTREGLNETLSLKEKLKEKLKEWGEGVVFLYTLVGEERYRVILVTPDARTDGKTEIRADVLNGKIADFRRAVMDPGRDPRPLGRELYDILVKPVEKQLEGAKAKTLLWSLDGDLRLLPLAALWDGRQYFGLKYQNVTITPASRDNLSGPSSSDWRALALGVSEARTVEVKELNETRVLRFNALPSVRAELLSIIRSERSPGGVMPGQSLLDTEFSLSALEQQLSQGYNVVHIASHFSLNPGDVTKSFLLLGDGNILTVRALRDSTRLKLTGVELLTLSACETAVLAKDSSGDEVEGFSYVAQRRGAHSILATLWPVADESTQLLMGEFYRLRKENPRLTKAAVLQLAQREMLEGKLSPSPGGDAGGGRGAKLAVGAEAGGPGFTADPSKPYAHPYYWSPFVLIGNWR